MCPSVWPLLNGRETAATMADLSRWSPFTKLRNSGRPVAAASSNHVSSRSGWRSRTKRRGERQNFLEPHDAFCGGAPKEPDLKQETSLLDGTLDVLCLDPPAQGGPQIVLLTFQLIELFRGWKDESTWIQQLRVEQLAKCQEIRRMALVHRLGFAGRQQPLPRVLANRLQQSVALGTVAAFVGEHERFAYQFCQQVEYVFLLDPLVRADNFGRFQAPAPGEHRQPVDRLRPGSVSSS